MLKNNPLRALLLAIVAAIALPLAAQTPKWAKKAQKAMLSIITYDQQGQMLHSTTGFYVSADGIALSDYKSFKGAARAVAFDAAGHEYPVTCILGANSLYDVVKLQVEATKTPALPVATAASVSGDKAFVLPYTSSQDGKPAATAISAVSTFSGHHAYYTLPVRLTEKWASCPVMNEGGQVIGLLQMAASVKDTCSYAVSALFADSLHTSALTPANADYQAIPMKKALPAEASQANSFIFLLGTRDTAAYLSYVNDYIIRFPAETNGYTMLAEMQAAQGRFDEAETTWTTGMKATAKEDELRYSRANTYYRQIQARQVPDTWTLEAALQDVEAASALNPLPLYASLRAQLLYSLKRYAEACEQFLALNQTNLRSADNYLYAAQCQQMRGDTTAVLALQDSAVACFTRPYVEAAAPALLMRANTLLSLERYREAVRDLNDYEHLKSNTLTANFYYRREQAEMHCRMFQQALDDIERAVKMEPREPLYHAELAVAHYRFNQLDEAIAAARAAIDLAPEFADAHRILGICLRAQGKEPEARAALQRAADLADPLALQLLNPQP